MSYSSSIDSPAHWVRDGAKWFLFRLSIYVAVAAISAGLFFVGAAVYAYVSSAAIMPADDLLPRPDPPPLAPIDRGPEAPRPPMLAPVKPDRPAPGGRIN
jgi:hypothetical protein